MVTNDATTAGITKRIWYEVAKLSWESKLKEGFEEIPYKIIPGPRAQFRCCIYREREIVRQRVKLARGLSPSGHDTKNIIQVISSACEDCPIARYTVTNNCQNCMGKACQQSCKFGAISMTRTGAYIDPDKCHECGMCAKACPYNAIADLVRPCKRSCEVGAITMNEYGICVIDEEKCVQCGACLHNCPFGAIGVKTSIVDVIEALKSKKQVYAMVAPAAEGMFGIDITMDSWRSALKKIGFIDMIELGLGGDMTAASEAKEWADAYHEGKKMTSSCCPAFADMIRKHFPELKDNISTTVSPMCAITRLIKSSHPDAIVVFIGPCQAKKSEVMSEHIKGNADYAVTFGEMIEIMKARDVILEPEEISMQQSTVYGKRFANSGGVSDEVLRAMREDGIDTKDIKVHICNGLAECKKAMMILKSGKLPEDFVEGMACIGGCIGGPGREKNVNEIIKDRNALLAMADERSIHDNLSMQKADDIDMHV